MAHRKTRSDQTGERIVDGCDRLFRPADITALKNRQKRPILLRQERTFHRRRVSGKKKIKVPVHGNGLRGFDPPVIAILHFAQNGHLQGHPCQPGLPQQVQIPAFFDLLNGLFEMQFRDERRPAGQKILFERL